MNDLIPGNLPVQFTDLGLTFEGEITFEQWTEVGTKIGRVARTSLFWVGDWLNYGQDRWNGGNRFEKMAEDQRQRYEEAMKETGLELATLQGAAHVARRIPLDKRSAQLSFEHHRIIARVKDEDKREDWIEKTEKSGLSTRRLRKSLNADRIVREREMQPGPATVRKTHLYWIEGIVQWWAEVRDDRTHDEMTREQLETVLMDFGPVLEIVDQLRDRAQKAEAYLDV